MSVVGPLGRTVADVALLLAAISGPDPRVPLALDAPPPALTDPAQLHRLLERDLNGVRVGWSADLGLPVEPQVRAVIESARQVLVDLGCQVIDTLPDLTGADEVFRTWRAFRFATKYGSLLDTHPAQLGDNVSWNVRRGLELTLADLSRATVLRDQLAGQVSQFFAEVDVLACPATQVAPFDVDLDWVHEIDGVPQPTYLDWMASAYLISATGLPAMSVPAGFTAAGLPVGLQLVGRRRSEWELLSVGHAFEAATGYSAISPGIVEPS